MRADQIGESDPAVAGGDRLLEQTQKHVLPHHPEAVGIELDGIPTCLEPFEQRFGRLAVHGDASLMHRGRLGIQQEIFVAELLRQLNRLGSIRRCDRSVPLPIVGEPGRGEECAGHVFFVAPALGHLVGRIVGVP